MEGTNAIEGRKKRGRDGKSKGTQIWSRYGSALRRIGELCLSRRGMAHCASILVIAEGQRKLERGDSS